MDNIFTRDSAGKEGMLRVILIANIVMFIVSVMIDPRSAAFSGSPFSFLSPSNESLIELGATGTIPLFQLHRWWTLIAASYLHGSLLHITFNMIALYQLGPLLIKEYGMSRMIIIYTFSGIGGYLFSSLLGVRLTIGASAAVCGLIGAALYYGKSRGGAYGQAIYSQIGGWALGIFLFGFIVPGINNFGHAGGMLVGALSAYILGYRERMADKTGHRMLSMVCIIGTAVVLLFSVLHGVSILLM